MITKPVNSLQKEMLCFLGHNDGKVKEIISQALDRVYDGLLISRAVWGEQFIIPAAIVELCRQRKLALVTFFRDGEASSGQNAAEILLLPERISIGDLKQALDIQGLRLQRLARLVSAEQDPASYLLTLLDKESLRRAAPAFVSVAIAPSGPDKYPILGPKSVVWKSEFDFPAERLLLPVLKESILRNGADAVTVLLEQLLLERRINIAPKARLITDNKILDSFVVLREQAAHNLKHGLELLNRLSIELPKYRSGLFDHKSGAICFDPHLWQGLAQGQHSQSDTIKDLLSYFLKKLPDAWSPIHPCFQRILWTPTRVLLRGEEYYLNMRRLSPFKRFELMLEEMHIICKLLSRLRPKFESIANDEFEWKLMLALLDQMRNISLQTFSFLHEAVKVSENNQALAVKLQGLWGDGNNRAHGLLRSSIHAYYGWLLRRIPATVQAANDGITCFTGIVDELRAITEELRRHVELEGLSQSEKLKDLIRGWREADHPGENLLTAVIATEKLSNVNDLIAVGIGWGGIELPLVVDYVAGILSASKQRQIFIAKYSHYRSEESPPRWAAFPITSIDTAVIDGKEVALLDDNTLTGITLEKLRDELLLLGATKVHMFITRYSGERRLHHMQMKEHGVIDPEFLAQEVDGYVGETPFARSWSKKERDYTNQIGIFSLARRRILECIYNNSTVELYEGEGL
jgi:hypoxanthine-guanine phosphoribosyltransferase